MLAGTTNSRIFRSYWTRGNNVQLSEKQFNGDNQHAGRLWAGECERMGKEIEKTLPWYSGLKFFSKTNSPWSFTLISRHWPFRLCWSWSIWVSFVKPGYRKVAFFKLAPWRNDRQDNLMIRLDLFWLVNFQYHRQPYDYMLRENWLDSHGFKRPRMLSDPAEWER